MSDNYEYSTFKYLQLKQVEFGKNSVAFILLILSWKAHQLTFTCKRSLNVGSCPNDDNSVQILFCPLLCSILIILCSESLAAKKKKKKKKKKETQDFASNWRFFICLFPLCWNSDSKNSFITCP